MAHIIEEYAKHCGVKISKPQLIEHFYSINADKYITISNSNVDCINYFYWEEVLNLLKENLAVLKEDIKIVQLSSPELKLSQVDIHVDNATINQVNYIIRNSLVHLCPDDPSCHVASAYDRPIVALFSHSHPSWSGPYWNQENKPSLLVADYKGNKPSLSPQENPSLINNIYPHIIVKEILEHLNLPMPISHTVVYIGANYHFPLYEIVPNFTSLPPSLQGKIINIRDDYFHSDENLAFWLNNYKSTIITNREIPLELLIKYKIMVGIVNFICPHDKMPSSDYLVKLSQNGVRFNIFAEPCLKEEIGFLRNKYFDYGIEIFKPPEIPEGLDLTRDDLYIRSKKVLLTKEGVFLGKYYWKNVDKLKKMGNDTAFIKVSDDQDFIDELNHFYIYER